MNVLEQQLQRQLHTLASQGLQRQLPAMVTSPTGMPAGAHAGIQFASNDYLNLSRHPLVIAAAQAALQRWGTGATGSRLLSGNLELFETFENRIATDKGSESALILNSGFQANATVLSALLDPRLLGCEPVVFTDRLNHASLHHACQTAGVHQHRYRHGDLDHLAELLERHYPASLRQQRPAFIITESIFSMDGDDTDPAALLALAEQYQATVYVDEAHATGLYGEQGYGLFSQWPTRYPNLIIMGTFSKALGSSGAYVACRRVVRDYLVSRCQGFIYSTAPSPAAVAAASMAWQMLPSLSPQRQQLRELSDYLVQQLAEHTSLNSPAMRVTTSGITARSHIIPVVIGSLEHLQSAQAVLQANGCHTSAIRPPTVPPHGARLRIALNSGLTKADIDYLVSHLATFAPR